MDTIEFKIQPVDLQPQSYPNQFNVEVVLNGIHHNRYVFNGAETVAASQYDLSEFDLFTCSCGIAGCAGFQTPIKQEKTEQSVQWTFPTGENYKVEKNVYVFDKAEFEKTFLTLQETILAHERNNQHLVSSCSDHEDEVKTTPFQKSLDWHRVCFSNTEQFNLMLQASFPTLFHAPIYLNYNGQKTQHGMDLFYLVCRSLNEWPKQQTEKKMASLLKNGKLAGQYIQRAIDKKEHHPLFKLIYKNYKAIEPKKDLAETIYSVFEFDLYKLVEPEDFDILLFSIVK